MHYFVNTLRLFCATRYFLWHRHGYVADKITIVGQWIDGAYSNATQGQHPDYNESTFHVNGTVNSTARFATEGYHDLEYIRGNQIEFFVERNESAGHHVPSQCRYEPVTIFTLCRKLDMILNPEEDS
jgi:hypothetical protein